MKLILQRNVRIFAMYAAINLTWALSQLNIFKNKNILFISPCFNNLYFFPAVILRVQFLLFVPKMASEPLSNIDSRVEFVFI